MTFEKGNVQIESDCSESQTKDDQYFMLETTSGKYMKYNEVANWFSVSRLNSILFCMENSSGFVVFYKLNDRQFNELVLPDSSAITNETNELSQYSTRGDLFSSVITYFE